jgi:hypothetical protein
MLFFPDELIKLIMYNVCKYNICKLLLVCKRFNNLINWEEYFEHRTNKNILVILDKPVNVKSYKYFMDIDDIYTSQIILYYPYIKYITPIIKKYSDFAFVIVSENKTSLLSPTIGTKIQWISLKNGNTKYSGIGISISDDFYKIISSGIIKMFRVNINNAFFDIQNIKHLL